MDIREAILLDLPDLRRLWDALHAESPQFYPIVTDADAQTLVKILAQVVVERNNANVWVAVDDNKIVGFLAGSIMQRPLGLPKTFLFYHWLYVEPAFRAHAVASLLCLAGVAWATPYGAEAVECASVAGHHYWARHGAAYATTYVAPISHFTQVATKKVHDAHVD